MFFVYVDRTTDGRPFYVGKGLYNRFCQRDRNKHWKNIADKHGWTRQAVIATKDEMYALEFEILLIAEHKTYIDDGWGANYTRGGDGTSGISEATRTKLAAAVLARPPEMIRRCVDAMRAARWKRVLTPEGRERMAAARRGKAPANKGQPRDEETKLKIAESERRTKAGRTYVAWNKKTS